jgi:hypothetical protein
MNPVPCSRNKTVDVLFFVIASEAKQSRKRQRESGLLRRGAPISTRARTTSRLPISISRCGSVRPTPPSFTTAAMPGARRETMSAPLPQSEGSLFVPEPRCREVGARRSRRRARRYQSCDPAQSGAALAPDQPHRDLARQRRLRPRHRRRHRGDRARQGQRPRRHPDAAMQQVEQT